MSEGQPLLTGANGRTGRAPLASFTARVVPVRAMVCDPTQAGALRTLGAAECVAPDMTERAAGGATGSSRWC